MKIVILLLVVFCSCKQNSEVKNEEIKTEEAIVKTSSEEKKDGFLFVNISKIYHHDGELEVSFESGNSILLKEKRISINSEDYEIIEEDYKYSKNLNVKAFFPEYGIFILKCNALYNDTFEVEINGVVGTIAASKFAEYIEFKDTHQFILSTYPIPNDKNPLRKDAHENSEIIPDFAEHSYVPIEIHGDWLKVKNDKDCYSGEEASSENITGWIRWKKNGKLILEVGYIC